MKRLVQPEQCPALDLRAHGIGVGNAASIKRYIKLLHADLTGLADRKPCNMNERETLLVPLRRFLLPL